MFFSFILLLLFFLVHWEEFKCLTYPTLSFFPPSLTNRLSLVAWLKFYFTLRAKHYCIYNEIYLKNNSEQIRLAFRIGHPVPLSCWMNSNSSRKKKQKTKYYEKMENSTSPTSIIYLSPPISYMIGRCRCHESSQIELNMKKGPNMEKAKIVTYNRWWKVDGFFIKKNFWPAIASKPLV